ncbi:class I SAM-dependent methyltransferase [Pseudomonas sp. gcc21]|uniref:class I SAM-dependent methyltransferase n=1 Tax=Pseudomonas sp. gcc21 TaxID=2726989 RepID=UPI00145164E4|nr:class I SAM-dependent methyltransferase [Pseudomonas sp. gcc21]QJD58202.1 class I SAM-dependent methyltransferase [Pseudomonas sp. gcc21]
MSMFRKFRGALWLASTLGLEKGVHITRYSMYRRLGFVGEGLPVREGKVLSISHSKSLIDVLGLDPSEVFEANYPEHNMLSLDFDDNTFDIVLSDQVLEHIEGNPQQAIDECFRVLKPGGIAIHTTCFINPVHGHPGDFWRFTPEALVLLHKGWAEILESGGWGNFDVWGVVRNHLRFAGIPHAKWHPLHKTATRNDPLWPVVTWVIARKQKMDF